MSERHAGESSMGAGKGRLLINAGANWAGFAAQMAAALVLTPILVDKLGGHRYGIWSLVESILAYLMLFDLGVAASVVRYVARFEAERDQDGLNRVFSTSVCIFTIAGVAALALAVGIALGGMHLCKIPADLTGDARWMLMLLGLNLALGLALGVFPSVLDGLERYPVKTVVRTAALLIRSAAFVAIVYSGGGLIELAWAITACNVAEHLFLALVVWYCLPGLRFSFRFVDRATFRSIRGYSLHAFLALIAGRVSFQTAAIVIGASLGPWYVTLYMLGARLVEYAKNALRAVTTVLTPAVSALDVRGDTEAIRRMLLDGTRCVLWLILPIQAGLIVLGKPFLAVWIKPPADDPNNAAYAELSYPTLVILAAPLGLALAQSVAARILYGMGRLRWFVRVVIIEAVVNLALSVALAGPLGIEGVAWGTTLPNLVANLAVMAYVCRVLGVGGREYARRSFARPCAAALLLAAGWALACRQWYPTCWADLLVLGFAGLAGYGLLAGAMEFVPAWPFGQRTTSICYPPGTSPARP